MIVFLVDVVVRVLALKPGKFLKESWIIFDVALTGIFLLWFVLCSALDTLNIRWMFLLQGLRMVILVGKIPELMILIKGLVAAMRATFFLLLSQITLTYLFALVFTSYRPDDNEHLEHLFHSVLKSMHTLAVHGFFLELTEMSILLNETAPGLEVCFWLYSLLSFSMIVMFAGCLCEIISAVSAVEKEALTKEYLIAQLQGHHEGCREFTREQFREVVQAGDIVATCSYAGIDIDTFASMEDMLFAGKDRMTRDDFATHLLLMCGGRTASSKDILALQKAMHENAVKKASPTVQDIQKTVAESVEPMQKKLDSIERLLRQHRGGTDLPGAVAAEELNQL